MKGILSILFLFLLHGESQGMDKQHYRRLMHHAVVAATPPPTYTTLDPAHKSTNISLVTGNLEATSAGGGYPGGQGGVISIISKSSGKWYWEVKVIGTAANCFIGLANTSYSPSISPGYDNNSWAYYGGSGANACYHNLPTTVGSGFPTYTTGDYIGLAYDAGAATVQFYKNGSTAGTLITGLAATMYAVIGTQQFTMDLTANFGASTFPFGVPAGYNSGLY